MVGRKSSVEAYLTVYLALIMSIMLSLCLALIEGTRRNAIRLESECVVDIGLNSVLAEYHRELFCRYNLFAIDSSYGTMWRGRENTGQHLQDYIERNLTMEDVFLSDFLYRDFMTIQLENIEMTKVSILTDYDGRVFRQRAVEAIKDDVGLELLAELQDWTDTITANELNEKDIAAEKARIDEEIQSHDGKWIQISEKEWTTVDIDNPTEGLEEIRKKGILDVVIDDATRVSDKAISTTTLYTERREHGLVNHGNVVVEDCSVEEELVERFFFQEYLLKYLGTYRNVRENSALDYQVEYLVTGKNNDIENLKSVANTICVIREAANAMYLFSDSEKCMEVELLANILASAMLVPEIAPLLKIAMLLGWAYAESVYDVKILLEGGRIPLVKNDLTWHYNIDSALSVGGFWESADSERLGLSYEDYLRIFMMFEDLNTLTGRAINMVEADIRLTLGNDNFQLDSCYDGIEACIRLKSKYGYEFEITRAKYYSKY